MDARRERRVFVQLPISFEGNQGVSKGMLFNLSMGVGRSKAEPPVQYGTHLTLRVHVPSLRQPIQVDRAEVTWTAGEDFGVQFVELGPEERARLSRVIEDLRQGILQHTSHHPVPTC